MKKYLILAALAASSVNPVLASDYSIDPSHTYVSFAVNHLGFSTGVTWNGEKLATVSGDLTMLGVSKPVTLQVTSMNCAEHPFNKKWTCGFDATGSIKRTDFGVNYGVPAVGEVLDLQIEVEAVRN